MESPARWKIHFILHHKISRFMKKSAEIYLNVLLFCTTVLIFLTLAYTLITGKSPYEDLGIDPTLGTVVTLSLVMMLFTVPYLLNQEFSLRELLGMRRHRRHS